MTPAIHRLLSPVFAKANNKHASASPEPKRKEAAAATKRSSDPGTALAISSGIQTNPILISLEAAIFEGKIEDMKSLLLTPKDASRALVYLCSIAASPMHAAMAKYLVGEAGANPNADNNSVTALGLLCGRMKRVATPLLIEILRILLPNADPNAGMPKPLEMTMDPEAVDLLLIRGAIPTSLSIQNVLLRDNPCWDIANMLIDAGKEKLSKSKLIEILTNLLSASKVSSVKNAEPDEMMMYPISIIFLLEQGAKPDQSHMQNALLRDNPCLDTAELFINARVPRDFDCLEKLKQIGRSDLFAKWLQNTKS